MLTSTSVLLLGAALFACLIEASLRLVGYGSVSTIAYGRDHYHPDLPDLGYAGRPNLYGIQTREGVSEVRFNSHGFHDFELIPRKDPNAFRLIVFGNSYTMAHQVSRENTYVARLQSEMETCSALKHRKIQTINLAVDGYTAHQHYILLRDYGLSLTPDLILMQVNDFALPGDIDPTSNFSPRVVALDGNVEIDRSYVSLPGYRRRASKFASFIQSLSDRSRLLQYVLEYRRRGNLFSEPVEPEGTAKVSTQLEPDRDIAIEKFDELVRSSGLKWFLTITPRADSTSFGSLQNTPIKDRWLRIAKRQNVPLIDVENEAREDVLATKKFLHGFGTSGAPAHLNRNGHALFARALSTHLCRELQDHLP
uniref:SGNH hydrolase-type esterase domain-containing protein n=1 Tax=Rhodopseudomonas palustris (strain BisA53) TaxID=316055 RepID=Q07SL7_RHOP5